MKRELMMAKLRERLTRRRAALRKTLYEQESLLAVPTDQSLGNAAEAAVDWQVGLNSQLAEAESRELAEIEDACERIRSRQYGICQECGRNISLARLKALPYATLCIRCQHERERPSYTRFEDDLPSANVTGDEWLFDDTRATVY